MPRPRTRSARSIPGLAALIALAAGTSASLAQSLTWNNAAGGTASTAANWSPVQIPVAADDLTYNLIGSYGVTFNASTIASHSQVFKRGTVTLTMSSPHTVGAGGITIGDLNLDNAIATLTTGTWNSGAGVVIGDALGSIGTLNVNDDDADLILTGATSDMTVGLNGDATLSITGGGLVTVADQFIAGSNSTSSPVVTVSGALAVFPFTRSTLNVLGTSQSRLGQGGDATVNISNGAIADFAGDLVVSNGSASTSTVTLAGAGGIGNILDATLDVAGDVLLGRNITAAAAAGVATMNVNADGSLLVGGTLFVAGDPDGGTATLNINTGGVVQATSVIDGAGGSINHTGGTLRINGGTYTGIPVPLSVSGLAANDVTLAFANNAAQTLVPAGGVSLIVGDDLGVGTFEGFLRVESGADLNMGNGDINIGDDAGVTGTVTITGVGSRLIANSVNSDVRAGFNGTGIVEVQSGGQLLCRNLLVPAINNAVGDMNCTGTGSNITTQFLAIGHSTGTGSGRLDVQQGATLSVTDADFSTNIRSTGILALGAGSTMTTPGTITLDAGGVFSVGGTVTNAALVDVNGGVLRSNTNGSGTPLVDAPVHVRAGGVLEAIVDDFTVGDAASTTGFVSDAGSTITVGANVLTLLDGDAADVDTVTLAGGTLAAPNGIDINNNGSIDGTGTITTPELFFNSGGGVITATGTGITINGILRNNSGTIDGTKFTFTGLGGGWTGAGTINARAQFDAGTEINALANMTIGAAFPDGVTLDGVLNCSDRIVTLVDSNGVGLGTLTTLDTGTLVCAQNLVVNNSRSLLGRGTVQCPLLTVFGIIRPGAGSAAGVGTLVMGALSMGVNADIGIDLGGTAAGASDRIAAIGPMTRNGALNVYRLPTYAPVAGDTITIVSAASFSGSFSSVTLPPAWVLRQTATTMSVRYCPGDFNGDGLFTVADIFAMLAAWFAHNPAADMNFNDIFEVADIFNFLAAWFIGCP